MPSAADSARRGGVVASVNRPATGATRASNSARASVATPLASGSASTASTGVSTGKRPSPSRTRASSCRSASAKALAVEALGKGEDAQSRIHDDGSHSRDLTGLFPALREADVDDQEDADVEAERDLGDQLGALRTERALHAALRLDLDLHGHEPAQQLGPAAE